MATIFDDIKRDSEGSKGTVFDGIQNTVFGDVSVQYGTPAPRGWVPTSVPNDKPQTDYGSRLLGSATGLSAGHSQEKGLGDLISERFSRKGLESLPIVGSLMGLGDAVQVYSAAKAIEAGNADWHQQKVFDDYVANQAENQARGTTAGYDIANIVASIPAFAGEFAMTGGGFSAARAATMRTIQGAMAKRLGAKAATSLPARAATQVAGAAAGVTAQQVILPTRTVANVVERQSPSVQLQVDAAGKPSGYDLKPGESLGEAAYKGPADEFIELGSERAGGLLGPLAQIVKKPAAVKKLIALIEKTPMSAAARAKLGAAFERAGIHSPFGESFEERVGDVARDVTGVSDQPSELTQIVTGRSGQPSGQSSGQVRLEAFKELLAQTAKEVAAFSVPGMAGSAAERVTRPRKPQVVKVLEEGLRLDRLDRESLAHIVAIINDEKSGLRGTPDGERLLRMAAQRERGMGRSGPNLMGVNHPEAQPPHPAGPGSSPTPPTGPGGGQPPSQTVRQSLGLPVQPVIPVPGEATPAPPSGASLQPQAPVAPAPPVQPVQPVQPTGQTLAPTNPIAFGQGGATVSRAPAPDPQAQLSALGWTPAQIAAMKPEQAARVIQVGMRPEQMPPASQPPVATPAAPAPAPVPPPAQTAVPEPVRAAPAPVEPTPAPAQPVEQAAPVEPVEQGEPRRKQTKEEMLAKMEAFFGQDGKPGKAKRGEAGKRLKREEKDEILGGLSDVYRENGLKRTELKHSDPERGEVYGYPNRPDLFITSDITGAKIRYYITLPDGRRAHPSELYPDIKQSDVDGAIRAQRKKERDEAYFAERRMSRVANDKHEAGRLYITTNRKREGSYFAQNDEGKIVRVDGQDPKDVEFYKARGFRQITGAIRGDSLDPIPAAEEQAQPEIQVITEKPRRRPPSYDPEKSLVHAILSLGGINPERVRKAGTEAEWKALPRSLRRQVMRRNSSNSPDDLASQLAGLGYAHIQSERDLLNALNQDPHQGLGAAGSEREFWKGYEQWLRDQEDSGVSEPSGKYAASGRKAEGREIRTPAGRKYINGEEYFLMPFPELGRGASAWVKAANYPDGKKRTTRGFVEESAPEYGKRLAFPALADARAKKLYNKGKIYHDQALDLPAGNKRTLLLARADELKNQAAAILDQSREDPMTAAEYRERVQTLESERQAIIDKYRSRGGKPWDVGAIKEADALRINSLDIALSNLRAKAKSMVRAEAPKGQVVPMKRADSGVSEPARDPLTGNLFGASTPKASPTGNLFSPKPKPVDSTAAKGVKGKHERRKEIEAALDALAVRDPVSAISGVSVGFQQGKRSLLGLAIRPFLRKERWVDVRGEKIKTIQDAVAVGRLFRNPQFETFHYIFVKAGKIVSHQSVSSRLPGFTQTRKGKDSQTALKKLRKRVRRIDHDAVYLFHNHPSGDVKTSPEDRAATFALARDLPNFAGHIVIDHDKYSIINAVGAVREDIQLDNPKPDFDRTPLVDHPGLHEEIKNDNDVAQWGRKYAHPDGNAVTVIYLSKGKVQGIEALPIDDLLDGAKFTAWLKGRGRIYASTGAVLYYNDRNGSLPKTHEIANAMAGLVIKDVVKDGIVDSQDFGIKAVRPIGWHKQGFQFGRTEEDIDRGTVVREDSPLFRPMSVESFADANAQAEVDRRAKFVRDSIQRVLDGPGTWAEKRKALGLEGTALSRYPNVPISPKETARLFDREMRDTVSQTGLKPTIAMGAAKEPPKPKSGSLFGDDEGMGVAERRGGYGDALSRRREVEGLRAAIKDPKTGEIYFGWTHQAAIDSAPRFGTPEHEKDPELWGRLFGEWDKTTDNVGFIDQDGEFISRSSAERRWGITTVEDRQDFLRGKGTIREPGGKYTASTGPINTQSDFERHYAELVKKIEEDRRYRRFGRLRDFIPIPGDAEAKDAKKRPTLFWRSPNIVLQRMGGKYAEIADLITEASRARKAAKLGKHFFGSQHFDDIANEIVKEAGIKRGSQEDEMVRDLLDRDFTGLTPDALRADRSYQGNKEAAIKAADRLRKEVFDPIIEHIRGDAELSSIIGTKGYIRGYFPHYFDTMRTKYGEKNAVQMMRLLLPKRFTSKFLEERQSKDWASGVSIFDVLPAYIQSTAKTIHDIPAYDKARRLLDEIPEGDGVEKKYIEWYLNNYMGIKPNPLGIEEFSEDSVAIKLSRKVAQLYYDNLIGLNPKTWIVNLTQPLTNTVPEIGLKYVVIGAKQLYGSKKARKIFHDSGLLLDYPGMESGIMSEGAWRRLMHQGMSAAEYSNRGITYLAGLAKAKDMGLIGPAAEMYAMDLVDKTQFSYGPEGQSRILSAITPDLRVFQTFKLKQTEFVRNLVADAWAERKAGDAGTQARAKLARFFAINIALPTILKMAGISLGKLALDNLGFTLADLIPGLPRTGTLLGKLGTWAWRVSEGQIKPGDVPADIIDGLYDAFFPGANAINQVSKWTGVADKKVKPSQLWK